MILLEVRNLTKSFGGLVAVKNISFDVEKGKIVSLIGPNGSGKTTIFNLITGFLKPDSGSVKFRGEEIIGLKPHDICERGIGRTFQNTKPLSNLSVLENVLIGALKNTHKIEEAKKEALGIIELTDLTKKRNMLAKDLTVADRKRLELARALATKPILLLLDEVMAGLNPTETINMINLIKKIHANNLTILIVEHVMKAVMSLSEHIIVLNYGVKIAEGPPQEISKEHTVIEAYLGRSYNLA
jgi:branched-chain amino acid transport system ATP-binding protein